jgi:oxygen-dependent protoporphyrinogen oxidase
MIQTKHTAQGMAETAANGVFNTPLFEALLSELNLPLAPRKATRKHRFIFRQRPQRWPLTKKESIAFGAKFFANWLTRSLKPKADETIRDWAVRTGGEAFANYLVTPALQGIYAGDVTRMSAEMIVGPLLERKKQRKPEAKGTVAPDRGMGQLIEFLTEWLYAKGVTIHTSRSFQIADETPTVIATSAWKAAELLKDSAPSVSEVLSRVEALPLLSVTLFFQQPPEKTRGFGCLFPPDQNFHSLGVLFNTDIFERRGRGRSETWILSGALHPEILSRSDEEIVAMILDDRVRLFGQFAKPVNVVVQKWPKALPHYTVEWKKALSELRLPKHLHLTGNYLGNIGLSRILQQNHELAEKIAGGL